MKQIIALLTITILVIFSSSCNQSTVELSPIKQDLEKEGSEITKILMQQKDDWNAFDIDKFMEGYWQSEELTFIGSRGITKGWQQTLDNYKKSYPDPEAMGKLDFEVIQLDVLDEENAVMIGRFTLFREKDTPTGLFTLRWKKFEGKWKIVSDQTCS